MTATPLVRGSTDSACHFALCKPAHTCGGHMVEKDCLKQHETKPESTKRTAAHMLDKASGKPAAKKQRSA